MYFTQFNQHCINKYEDKRWINKDEKSKANAKFIINKLLSFGFKPVAKRDTDLLKITILQYGDYIVCIGKRKIVGTSQWKQSYRISKLQREEVSA